MNSPGFKILLSRLFNPLTLNRESLLPTIKQQFLTQLQASSDPYYCTSCQKKHIKGALYKKHQNFAWYIPDWVKILQHSPDIVYHEQIVGIYYTQNVNYLKTLKSGVQLELRPEPFNQHDSFAVSVWHDNRKLGYIPRGSNQRIFTILGGKVEITCLLGHYIPSHGGSRDKWSYYPRDNINNFVPERATITIHVFDPAKFQQLFIGLMELTKYIPQISSLHTQIVDALEILGYRALRSLETSYDESNPIESKLFIDLSARYKIPLKNSEYAIIL